MKIVSVASESNPLCKTGGLADVVYSLSKELVVGGEDVSVIVPYYSTLKNVKDAKKVCKLSFRMSWRHPECDVFLTEADGIKFYLIRNDQYFSRGHLYGDWDDGERFAFFTIASMHLLKELGEAPDIIHIHDWQGGMLPCLIKETDDGFFKKTKFVGTIHNPAFQGLNPMSVLGDFYNLPDELFHSGKVRFNGQVSTLKTMIVYCDKITTVSPTHHLELLTEDGGMGLDGVLKLREFDFSGILNGIDYKEFNPSTDPHIAAQFTTRGVKSGKAANKKALLKEFNLKDDDAPVFSLVSRVTWQKGMDLVFPAIDEIVKRGGKVVLLGSGEYRYEEMMEAYRARYPENVGIYIGYSDPMAHRIYAGSDFFLMPSLFEPCGLGQMIAQRYGTLPIVRRTGGLADSVINYDGNNLETSNGFGFDIYCIPEMINTCMYAYDAYENKEVFKKLVSNAVKTDNSWVKSTKDYMKVYKSLIK